MTVYEQIQKALDLIEGNLFTPIRIEQVAAEANMSIRCFYNYFWTITGHTYKEYLLKRRLAEVLPAVRDESGKIIDIALRSGYESHEAFPAPLRKNSLSHRSASGTTGRR